MLPFRRTVLLAALIAAPSLASAQAGATSPADVAFMQDMMHHHAQAVEMCGLAADRATAPVKSFCKRADVSQRDEIETMSRWLKARGQEAPEVMGHHHGGMEALEHSSMPGMMTPAEMTALAKSSGLAFDRLFIPGMIRHHEGAITMVKKLFDTSGAGQGSEIFGIASGIDTDQRAEIERLKGLLAALPAK